MTILGFGGKAGSGKTTAARMMTDVHPGPSIIMPMATVLRKEVYEFLKNAGANQEYLEYVYGNQAAKTTPFHIYSKYARANCSKWDEYLSFTKDIQQSRFSATVTIRTLLQWWGTEYRRAQDPDYWTKAWLKLVSEYNKENFLIIVDDVRFPNEYELLRALNGTMIRIDRPSTTPLLINHVSESSLDHLSDDWDAIILNNGDLDELKKRISTIKKLVWETA